MESSWSLSSTQRIVFFGFIGSPSHGKPAKTPGIRFKDDLKRRRCQGARKAVPRKYSIVQKYGRRVVTELRAYYGCARKNVKCRVRQRRIFLWRFLSWCF